jgi:hypothetical protein
MRVSYLVALCEVFPFHSTLIFSVLVALPLVAGFLYSSCPISVLLIYPLASQGFISMIFSLGESMVEDVLRIIIEAVSELSEV